MRVTTLILCIIPSITMAEGNINIGGNDSFNNYKGEINVNATSSYTIEQSKNLERLEARIAEIGSQIFNKNIPKDKIKELNAENAILNNIKEINGKQMPISSKNNICKSKAKGYFNLLGYELNFLYSKCDSYFGS